MASKHLLALSKLEAVNISVGRCGMLRPKVLTICGCQRQNLSSEGGPPKMPGSFVKLTSIDKKRIVRTKHEKYKTPSDVPDEMSNAEFQSLQMKYRIRVATHFLIYFTVAWLIGDYILRKVYYHDRQMAIHLEKQYDLLSEEEKQKVREKIE